MAGSFLKRGRPNKRRPSHDCIAQGIHCARDGVLSTWRFARDAQSPVLKKLGQLGVLWLSHRLSRGLDSLMTEVTHVGGRRISAKYGPALRPVSLCATRSIRGRSRIPRTTSVVTTGDLTPLGATPHPHATHEHSHPVMHRLRAPGADGRLRQSECGNVGTARIQHVVRALSTRRSGGRSPSRDGSFGRGSPRRFRQKANVNPCAASQSSRRRPAIDSSSRRTSSGSSTCSNSSAPASVWSAGRFTSDCRNASHKRKLRSNSRARAKPCSVSRRAAPCRSTSPTSRVRVPSAPTPVATVPMHVRSRPMSATPVRWT